MYHRSRVTTAPAVPELTPVHRSEAPESSATQSLSPSNLLSRVAVGPSGPPRAQAHAQALSRASGGQLVRTGPVLLQLQRQYGNVHVQHVMNHAGVRSNTASVIQAKLVLGAADSKYEREADRVAQQVVGQMPSEGQQAQQQADSSQLMRAPDSHAMRGVEAGAVNSGVQQTIQDVRGGGQLLPMSVRKSVEQALGADFSGVRVHDDAQSDRLNRSLRACAFTTGQDIFFRKGAYNPATRKGKALIAHELTHVVQQQGIEVQRLHGNEIEPQGLVQRNGWEPTEHFEQQREKRRISRERVQEILDNGTQYSDEDTGAIIYYGRGLAIVTDGDELITIYPGKVKSRWTRL